MRRMKTFQLKFKWSKNVTPNIKHLAFVREDGDLFDFIPGQFITFLFDVEDKIKRRSYSIASIPGKTDETEIVISYMKDGIASEALFNLAIDECLTCSGPFGRLIIRETDQPKRFIFVGTGTGVAPYRSMLPGIAQRLENDKDLEIILLLGVQYRKDLLYAQDFIEFANIHERFTFHAYLSRDALDDAKDYEHKGYVQSAFPDLNLDPNDDLVYLCGNPNMIDQAYAWLTEEGFSPHGVRREKYISSN